MGDCKSVGEDVSELRIDFGPGYSVYFGQDGNTLVILLCGGSKKTQRKDINQAIRFWADYLRRKMTKLARKYRDDLLKDLKDPKEAAEYLNAALQDGNQEIFLMALRDVAAAKGIKMLAGQTSLNRENLYRMLSNEGNPNLSSLATILDNLGLQLAIAIKEVQPSHSI